MNCICLHEGGCDVVNETETPAECPYVQDFCNYYQVDLAKKFIRSKNIQI